MRVIALLSAGDISGALLRLINSNMEPGPRIEQNAICHHSANVAPKFREIRLPKFVRDISSIYT